jgi:hypothetical protein
MTHAEADDAPPPIQQKARSQFDLDGCKINRVDLDRAVALARQDFPPDASVRIDTTRTSGGIATRIFGESVDDLLASVRRATLPGNPDLLDNFTLTIADSFLSPAPRADRYVAMFVGPQFVRVVVEGNDPGWVSGRISGLRAIFDSTRVKWIMKPRKFARLGIAINVFSALVAVGTVIIIEKISDPVFRHHREIFLLILLLCALVNVALVVAIQDQKRRRRMELRLLGPAEKRDWSFYTFIFTVIITIATIAVLAVAVISALATK